MLLLLFDLCLFRGRLFVLAFFLVLVVALLAFGAKNAILDGGSKIVLHCETIGCESNTKHHEHTIAHGKRSQTQGNNERKKTRHENNRQKHVPRKSCEQKLLRFAVVLAPCKSGDVVCSVITTDHH